MSKGIRYDSLLARALGGELHRAIAGAGIRAYSLDHERRLAALYLDDDRVLRFDLHPERGFVSLARSRPSRGATSLLGHRVQEISVPPDERRLHLTLSTGEAPAAGGASAFEWIVDWTTNRWNVWLISARDRSVIRALRAPRRGRKRGAAAAPGEPWRPPGGAARAGATGSLDRDEWVAILSRLPSESFERGALRTVAYVSPINLAYLLQPASGPQDREGLAVAYARWKELVEGEPRPHVLVRPWAGQPYPHNLGEPDARRVPSLLEAMLELRRAAVRPVELERATSELERRQAAVERRIAQLRENLVKANESTRLRHAADLLLASLDRVSRGAERVELDDFEGGRTAIELDPTLSPAKNAERLYAEARRLRRGAERIPALLEAATNEIHRLTTWLERVQGGEVPPELRRSLRRTARARPEADRETVPYRRYRTSGGLEVRVGRSAQDNDALTLRHASPQDVWMHARGVPGSHVVLRWNRRDQNPPERDLLEAATLAAWFSKARSSQVVAIDWTRRRYVRKPRRAPPGTVTLERAKTVFVEPSEEVERGRRVEDDLI